MKRRTLLSLIPAALAAPFITLSQKPAFAKYAGRLMMGDRVVGYANATPAKPLTISERCQIIVDAHVRAGITATVIVLGRETYDQFREESEGEPGYYDLTSHPYDSCQTVGGIPVWIGGSHVPSITVLPDDRTAYDFISNVAFDASMDEHSEVYAKLIRLVCGYNDHRKYKAGFYARSKIILVLSPADAEALMASKEFNDGEYCRGWEWMASCFGVARIWQGAGDYDGLSYMMPYEEFNRQGMGLSFSGSLVVDHSSHHWA